MFQIANFLFITLDLQRRVQHEIDSSFIGDFHHAGRELESRCRLFHVTLFWPNVRYHNCLAIATERISQEIGKFGLPVGNVISLAVAESKHDLLKECERLVDEAGLFENDAFGASLLDSLTS